jgi:hypothetical protein
MLDDRFSARAFAQCGIDSDEARKLADLLAEEIQVQIHKVAMAEMQAIARRLNSMGHELRLCEEPQPGDIEYRDDSGTGENYRCKLRVGFDSVISTGYSHLYTGDEDPPEES